MSFLDMYDMKVQPLLEQTEVFTIEGTSGNLKSEWLRRLCALETPGSTALDCELVDAYLRLLGCRDIMPSSHWQDVKLEERVTVVDANALGLQLVELRHSPDGRACIFFPVRVDSYWRAVVAFPIRSLLLTLDSGPRNDANRKAEVRVMCKFLELLRPIYPQLKMMQSGHRLFPKHAARRDAGVAVCMAASHLMFLDDEDEQFRLAKSSDCTLDWGFSLAEKDVELVRKSMFLQLLGEDPKDINLDLF